MCFILTVSAFITPSLLPFCRHAAASPRPPPHPLTCPLIRATVAEALCFFVCVFLLRLQLRVAAQLSERSGLIRATSQTLSASTWSDANFVALSFIGHCSAPVTLVKLASFDDYIATSRKCLDEFMFSPKFWPFSIGSNNMRQGCSVGYLWVLLDGNEDSLGQLDVFIADDVEVFLHVTIFPQFITFTLLDLWQGGKKTKLGTADERFIVLSPKFC